MTADSITRMRSSPLRSNPETTRAWQDRSRRAAAQRNGGSVVRKVSVKAKALTPAERRFQRAVRERDMARGGCQFPHLKVGVPCSGGHGEVHHLINRTKDRALKYDPHNGVLLCDAGHRWIGLNIERARLLRLYGSAGDKVFKGRVIESRRLPPPGLAASL